jgi:hypothetical protein
MSGFSDDAFSLDALRAEPSDVGLQGLDLDELHRELLVAGCHERLQLCRRLAEDAEAEADAIAQTLRNERLVLPEPPLDQPASPGEGS